MTVVRARPVILLAAGAAAVLLVVTVAATRPETPARLSQVSHTTTVPASVPPPSTTVALPTPTTTVGATVTAEAIAVDQETVPPGLVVTNSGSAIADVGGNVVSGSPGGDVGTVVTGDATAIGNSTSERRP